MNRRVLAALGAVVAIGCDGGAGDPSRIDAILALEGEIATGATVYSANCTACHGADGGGASAPDLNSVVPPLSDSDLVDTVLTGANGMPDFAQLSDQAIADLLAHLRDAHG